MIGFGEIIVLLLSLGGFGLTPNPTPPTPDQSLAYGAAEADLVVHFDAATVVPGNFKALTKLADEPAIKASPELRDTLRQAIGQIEAGRGMARGMLGLDPVNDINSATIFVQLLPERDPSFVLAVRGKFPADLISKAAQLSGNAVTKVGASAMADLGDSKSIGLTRDGVLLVGSTAWIKPRLADSWKAPARAAGSPLAKMAEVLAGKPFFAVGGSISPVMRALALKELKSPNFASDLVKRHKFFSFSFYTDGVGWRWDDSTRAGLDSMKLFSEGMIEVMRAAQIAPRGVAKMAAASMESYRGTSKQLDEVIRRKDDLLKLVDSFSGDGKFAATINADPRTLRLDVRATAATFSQVAPFGMLLPFAGAAYFGFRTASPGPVIMEQASPQKPPPPPGKWAPKPQPTTKPKTLEKTTH
jgi:hypothetical protein